MGVAPELLPGAVTFSDSQFRDTLNQAWDTSLPDVQSGAHLMDILNRCRKGEIKALYVVGENPLETLPASFDVKGALEKLEVLICQDPFLTETAKLAHVVFPASTFAEKDGTVTNQEGKVQYLRPALDSLGESTLDWHIMVGMANILGAPMDYETTQDIQQEIRKILPGYYNLGKAPKVELNSSPYFSNRLCSRRRCTVFHKWKGESPSTIRFAHDSIDLPFRETFHTSLGADRDFAQQEEFKDGVRRP